MTLKIQTKNYPFHKANIHEKRWAAVFCRMFPLLCFVSVGSVGVYATFRHHYLLLWLAGVFNVSMWLWIVHTSLLSIYATVFKLEGLEQIPRKTSNPDPIAGAGESGNAEVACINSSVAPVVLGCTGSADQSKVIRHLIVLPNYKEDESMLKDTLTCFAECEDSHTFCIVLGMEDREGMEGVRKANNLARAFQSTFAEVLISNHPRNLKEMHLDGSETAEVPGKASNLKYAVKFACDKLEDWGIDAKQILLTIADADCLFHPLYFSHVSADYKRHGSFWTMWQAPQFQYRNYHASPIVSRVWSYVSSVYEFGGLAATTQPFGNHHMVHSSYTMPLELAYEAQPWDGDGIAEDHHAFLTCFFYRLQQTQKGGRFQNIDVRPVYLPVKSTAVASEGYLQSWLDRWSQAKRHTQGVSELPYALLAVYDAFMEQPWYNNRMLEPRTFFYVWQALCRLFCMHLLPILQGLCLGLLTVTWFANHRRIDMCPTRLWAIAKPGDAGQTLLCGLAGAWVLTWPVVVPMFLLLLSNFLLLRKCFLCPSSKATLWHSEDGGVPNNSSCRVFFTLVIDAILGMSWILFIYGFVVEVMACVNVAISGNDFVYVTANKGVCCKKRGRGKMSKSYGTVEAGMKGKLPLHGSLPELQEKLNHALSASKTSETPSLRASTPSTTDCDDEEASVAN